MLRIITSLFAYFKTTLSTIEAPEPEPVWPSGVGTTIKVTLTTSSEAVHYWAAEKRLLNNKFI